MQVQRMIFSGQKKLLAQREPGASSYTTRGTLLHTTQYDTSFCHEGSNLDRHEQQHSTSSQGLSMGGVCVSCAVNFL